MNIAPVSRRLAAERKARKAREAYRKEASIRARNAAMIRQSWTPEELAEEAERLAEEIAARLASDQVSRFPTMWAHGATQN